MDNGVTNQRIELVRSLVAPTILVDEELPISRSAATTVVRLFKRY